MSVSAADLPIGPITHDQARRASWLGVLDPVLSEVATRTELAAYLENVLVALEFNLGVPCTAPVDDEERRSREKARVWMAIVTRLQAELGIDAKSCKEEVLV